MKKYYIFENNYNIETFDNKNKAIDQYNYFLERLTDNDKKHLDYFRLYEIEVPDDVNIKSIDTDLQDFISEMVFKFK